jgi:8-oxo-dGTP pyrophosphatase MutT (NUDIX family)
VPIPDFVVELRQLVGDRLLWLPGVTAVVRSGDSILLVQRSDNLQWTPVTGIVDPGEEPAVCAVREAREETGVDIVVDRLAMASVGDEVVYPNGDRARYLDLTFACTWRSGDAHVADDESVDVRWCQVAELPPMGRWMTERIEAALSDEQAARFRL